jgi:hypothetical protein
MVAISVRLSEYCPIFFFPSLCFTTYYIPLVNLPFNVGPFVLLFITKFILPRSSLIGHLSGIIIGYPLAWNLINWMTPPIFLAICICIYIHVEDLYAWKLPYFNSLNPIAEFVDENKLWKYFFMKVGLYSFCVLLPLLVVFSGLSEIFPRATLVFLCWNAIAGRRTEWLTEQRSVNLAAGTMVLLSMLIAAVLTLTDIISVAALVGSWTEVVALKGSLALAAVGLTVLCLSVAVGVLYILSCLSSLYDIPAFLPTMQSFYLYSPETQGYLNRVFGFQQMIVPEIITNATTSTGPPAYRELPIEDTSSSGADNSGVWVGRNNLSEVSAASNSNSPPTSARARAAEAALARLNTGSGSR